MGCGASKRTFSVTPALDSSGVIHGRSEGISASSSRRNGVDDKKEDGEHSRSRKLRSSSRSFGLGNLSRYIEGEQVAAGWPGWLSAVAAEAIQGWVPLKSDAFEKLEKIGQGTYSSVFRARNFDTGKIVALKKVRFDNLEPESVRFMAREIQILRRLDHPNVLKLEGLITSRLSCSMYLVFEYMEHDLAGLSSCPEIKFSDPQIKCYMQQLLFGLDHCHSRGIIHRDIKGANLLVNNEGILKIADFGLANFSNPGHKQPLTSRVVTLWYRPPELLLGSTDYEETVDLWSAGCVFAEMFFEKPILQGRTEVEQLHKIFKVCGSPTDEYWKKSKLPHATIFKPRHRYESCLREMFNYLPTSDYSLLETLLSVEPDMRGTASIALASEYFKAKPYACAPSSLPKYPPNKEIDAKCREELRRNRVTSRACGSEALKRESRTYRPSREPSGLSKLATRQEDSRINGSNQYFKGDTRLFVDLRPVAAINSPGEGGQVKHNSDGGIPFSGPLLVRASSGFAWVKNQKEDHHYLGAPHKCSSKNQASSALDPSKAKDTSDLKGQANGDLVHDSKGHSTLKKWRQLERPDSFNSSDVDNSKGFSGALYMEDAVLFKHSILGYEDQGERVEFSGPILSQTRKVDELLEKHERHIRQAVRRSWFQRVPGKKQGK